MLFLSEEKKQHTFAYLLFDFFFRFVQWRKNTVYGGVYFFL